MATIGGDLRSGGAANLFHEDVPRVLAALMESATEDDVLDALLRYASTSTVPGEAEKRFLHGTSQIVLCEYAAVSDNALPLSSPLVFAAQDLPAAFQNYAESGTSSLDTTVLISGSPWKEKLPLRRMVRCILLSRRDPSSAEGTAGCLTLRQLNIFVVDMRQPLDSLQSLLQSVYEPFLRSQRDVTLRLQLHDFVSTIRSRCQALAEVDIKQFVHPDLLGLCAAHPLADLKELVGLLGPEKSTDAAFLRQVLVVRNRCRSVLDVQLEGKEIISARDEVAYWQSVLSWIELTQRQLQSREWRLVHRLLSHRVETSYEVEFSTHAQLVRDYLAHLREIPYNQIDTVEERNFTALVAEIFEAVTRPTQYPPAQSLRLIDCVVGDLAECLAGFAAKTNVFCVDEPEAQLRRVREIIDTAQELQQRSVECAEYFRDDGIPLALSTPLRSATPLNESLASLPSSMMMGTVTSITAVSATTITGGGGGVGIPVSTSSVQHTTSHPMLVALLTRARQLWAFINEHFYYERALRQIFAADSSGASSAYDFCSELTDAFDRFVEVTKATASLWDVSTAGIVEFNRAFAAYERCLASLDGRLALLVGTMLATAQEMGSTADTGLIAGGNNNNNNICYHHSGTATSGIAMVTHEMGGGSSLYRIYSRFRPLRREKIQSVVSGFQMALLEQITREMKNVRERYFDTDRCRDATRLFVARFGVTPEVGRMLWERSVQQEMETYLVARDAISEHGWHQLMHLRTIEHRWCLNEQLAHFFGLSLADLVTKELHADSEAHGTAYALAYLDVIYAKEKTEWSKDPHIAASQQFVQQHSPRAVAFAKSRLVLFRVGQGQGGDQHEVRDARNFCDTIAQRLQERVVQWCEGVRRYMAGLDLFPETLAMKGPLLHLVNLYETKKTMMMMMSGSPVKRAVMPHIPRDLFALLRDLHMLDGMKLLLSHTQLVSDVRSFFRHNEDRFRIANCLTELVYAFEAALDGDDELFLHLVTEDYTKVYQSFVDGARLRWSDEAKVQQFTADLSERICAFSIAAEEVRRVTTAVERGIQHLQENHYVAEAVIERVTEMCVLVERLATRCSNTSWWTRRVQPRLDTALARQVEEHLRRWTDEFLSMGRDTRFLDPMEETKEFKLRPLRVRMRVVYKEIDLAMSMAACRHHWVNELNRCFAWVHTLPPLLELPFGTSLSHNNTISGIIHNKRSSIKEKGGGGGGMGDMVYTSRRPSDAITSSGTNSYVYHSPSEETYDRLFGLVSPQALTGALQAIEKSLQDALEVEGQWRRGQHLLNLDVVVLQQRFGDDLGKWADALKQIRDLARKQMDYTQPSTLVGGIVIVADDAQKELGRKLDSMTQYVHSRYCDLVERQLEFCYRRIIEERNAAENYNVMNDNDAVRFICELPNIQLQLKEVERCIVPLEPAEEYLRRQGFVLPETWIHAKRVREELRAYRESMDGKVKALECRRPFLCESAKAQENDLRFRIDELEKSLCNMDMSTDPADIRAVAGSNETTNAHESPSPELYSRRIKELQDRAAALMAERQKLLALQDALGAPRMVETKLELVAVRAEELQWICGHIARTYSRLSALEHTPFFEIVPRQLHEDLSAIEQEIRGFPDSVKGHRSYEELKRTVERRLECRRLVQELRSDAMAPLERAERHWMSLRTQLKVNWRLDKLTVGDVWITDPMANVKIYHDVLEFAQGERRIETQLHHIISFWNDFEFTTKLYRKQFVLIRGWDVVFERLADDANCFQGIRASPFFTSQHVISTATDWDARLTSLRQLLEVLMNIQRRWVHLDGIFSGNKEIRKQLPNDSIQFDRASRDFMELVPAKPTAGSSVVLKAQDFLEDKHLYASLIHLDTQLSRVQRALSVYLDRQRRQFPRFFFVGDDDLLETLGNSSNPAIITKHLPKMFTAIANLTLSEDGKQVLEFLCAEGEKVTLAEPIEMDGRALHEWLACVEQSMSTTLHRLTMSALADLLQNGRVTTDWIAAYPLQVVCLAFQAWWVHLQEDVFAVWKKQIQKQWNTSAAVSKMVELLDRVSLDVVSPTAATAVRRAAEELITLAVYQRDISRVIQSKHITLVDDFEWLRVLRLYLIESGLQCHMADAHFSHGFEYIGWYQRLVQTALTDRCYLTLTQALHTRIGGSPVGPAGSGKTETVKALGTQLGRHVLVFNCDDAFDFDAMGRIFLGLCQVGAWGCFDEFNRLEERVLSAVSQQIQLIQESLRAQSPTLTFGQQTVPLCKNVALFVTMNPGFAGRSNLPGNLKQLFRTMTMAAPDRETIAEVMLFAQGFRAAESHARKIVLLFYLCEEQLSQQAHYDFGLRALKSVLVTAGDLKRRWGSSQNNHQNTNSINDISDNKADIDKGATVDTGSTLTSDELESVECDFILRSLIRTVTPRLVTEDAVLFDALLRDFFHDRPLPATDASDLRACIQDVCRESGYAATPAWVEKICQLYCIRQMRHGLMLVGPSGTGKSACWQTLLRAMARLPHGALEAHAYIVDPKAMSKAELFGVFEATTREWKDGVFTEIMRRIVNNDMGNDRAHQQHWIIFDGDVDPHWVENLNSLLDDNKVYTLPNGERLSLSPSVRIVFEVQDLRYATPATVSRCGMVWFSRGTVPMSSILNRMHRIFYTNALIDRHGRRRLNGLVVQPLPRELSTGNYFMIPCSVNTHSTNNGGIEELVPSAVVDLEHTAPPSNSAEGWVPPLPPLIDGTQHLRDGDHGVLQLQVTLAHIWAPAFAKGGVVERALNLVMEKERYRSRAVMAQDELQYIRSLYMLLLDGIWRLWRHCQSSTVSTRVVEQYATRHMDYSLLWSFGASLRHEDRGQLAIDLGLAPVKASSSPLSLLQVEADPATGEWCAVRDRVRVSTISADKIGSGDTVVTTVDTCRHENLLRAWIGGGSAAVLCGPPGSGKTMSITAILRASTEYNVVFLNFSSGTRPDTVIRALEQYGTITSGPRGPILAPASGKRLLLFCDEINLPALDTYGTQPVIQLLRQLVERGGYYRSRDNVWIAVEGVQVIGACNPPTDAGRTALSHRFLRWAPVLFVDFPSEESLHVIYTTYCRAILTATEPSLQSHAEPLAQAMVAVYMATQRHFTSWQQPHYVYSPRELSRWTRALYEGLLTYNVAERRGLHVESLVRLAVHEGLRVFQDRLVERGAREWTDATMDQAFKKHFPKVSHAAVLRRPLIYSSILQHVYSEGSREALRTRIEEHLAAFCEEEINTSLVVHDAMVDHVTRIDRVMRQPLGHLLLAGASGVGKTITARLVAWMNGVTVFRLDVHRNYQLSDFENDLRELLRRTGCRLERVCFIFDDTNILEASFLEYMNALLASGEVPGLFDGEEWTKLMEEIRDSVTAQQLLQQQHQQQQQQQTQNTAALLPFLLPPFLSATSSNSSFSAAATTTAAAATTLQSSIINSQSLSSSSTAVAAAAAAAADGAQQDSMQTAAYVDTRSEQELYRWFVENVRRNLHVVFTINPSSGEFSSRARTSSALFNRCTIIWFGDWDRETRYQLTRRLTSSIDIMFSCGKTFAKEEDARNALNNALCRIHDVTVDVNRVVRLRNAHSGTFVTPRHFSDCVHQLQLLYKEKRSGSTGQLAHLRSGLAKLDGASEEVEQQRAQLRAHEAALAESGVAAQQMLDRIISDTETTKKEKASAERLRIQLREEEETILSDKDRVQKQLAAVEPALHEAEVALNTIRPEYLREIRAYATPPPMVKRVLEAVLVTMGLTQPDEWDVIKQHIRRDDFLAEVKAFRPRSMANDARLTVCGMLAAEDFTREAAYRASKAAGPLLVWVEAQLKYAEIAMEVEPMRMKIDQLTAAHDAKLKALSRTEAEIAGQEVSLRKLKDDYQAMTERTAEIKNRMAGVAARCERATTLLRQLLDECSRWKLEAQGFDTEVRTMLGDCVLAAAALAYFGYFDEHTRQSLLLPHWRQCLCEWRIPHREHVGAVELLVTPQARLKWEQHGLPSDNFYVENAMILSRCQRYPLLIDPSGVAAAFLLQHHLQDKIQKASFSKPGYLKQLDMAVRFGYPILMEDAEFMDPALSPLINREVHHTGGHALTRLGARDIDMAATFRLFLVTRDSNYQPSAGMAGRVCLVNFTETEASLESQCRHRIMLHEHAELDERRTRILYVQEEYHLRLRMLEQELLTTIASSEGSLLQNDVLTVALERLKDETRALQNGIAESESAMTVIAHVERIYQPLATAVARMYFALRRFSRLHGLYRFNAEFVFKVIADALAALPSRTEEAHACMNAAVNDSIDLSNSEVSQAIDTVTPEKVARLHELTRYVFNIAHHRARRSMFAQDHLVLAIVLGKLRSGIGDDVGRQITVEEWKLLEPSMQSHDEEEDPNREGKEDEDNNKTVYRKEQQQQEKEKEKKEATDVPAILHECVSIAPDGGALAALLRRPLFASVRRALHDTSRAEAWRVFFSSAAPSVETMPMDDADDTISETRRAFITMLFLLHTRRDAFAPAAATFLRCFFNGPTPSSQTRNSQSQTNPHRRHPNSNGEVFLAAAPPDLADVQSELSDRTPLILVASGGIDPAAGVEGFARAMDIPLRAVAMGSANGVDTAERHLAEAMSNGWWVLLKNIHLARSFACVVEKRMHHERAEGRLHRNFRLILSMESTGRVALRNSEDLLSASPPDGDELPASLIEASIVLVYEPPPGMKSSLLQTIGAVRPGVTGAHGGNVPCIYLAAAWLHAVVMERLLYVPMGWSTRYEFNDTEFWRILQAIDHWVVGTAGVDMARVPWTALQCIIGTTLYGGKISNPFDQLLLDSFCARLMSAAVLNASHDGLELHVPSLPRCGTVQSLQDAQAWVRALPETGTPLWAQLPTSAARVVQAEHAAQIIEQLTLLRVMADESPAAGKNEDAEKEKKKKEREKEEEKEEEEEIIEILSGVITNPVRDIETGPAHASWAQTVHRLCRHWCGVLGPMAETFPRDCAPCNNDPVALTIHREFIFARSRLLEVLDDLAALDAVVCARGPLGVNPTAAQRAMMDALLADRTPTQWARGYRTYSSRSAAGHWIADFVERATHVRELNAALTVEPHEGHGEKREHILCVTLGWLFWPGAFLTATKQHAARQTRKPLEQMRLRLDLCDADGARDLSPHNINTSEKTDTPIWRVMGLTLFAARVVGPHGQCEVLPADAAVPSTRVSALLRWELIPTAEAEIHGRASLLTRLGAQNPAGGRLATPLYANPRRDAMLDVVELNTEASEETGRVWYERGVCLTAWSAAFA